MGLHRHEKGCVRRVKMDRVTIKTVSAVEAVSDMLEEDIYSLTFKMGEKIKESDLVERYGVSRNTLREAMAYLVSKGLLEKVANKGIYVKSILPADIEDIFHLRELLEGEAIRRVIRSGAVPRKLYDLADLVSAYDPETHCVANLNADIEFHRCLIECAGSARLVKLYENQLSEVKLCIFQSQAFVAPRPENTVLHYRLLERVEAGDMQGALARLSEHMESAIATYQAGLARRRP